MAFFIPITASPKQLELIDSGESNRPRSPLRSLEHSLHTWVAYAILPLFAFANAGVSLKGLDLASLLNPLTLGIAAGLFLGKQLGVFFPIWLGLRARWFDMPEGANLMMLYGTAVTTGIGFTMSFFIGSLAYEDLGPAFSDSMKLGVLSGSMLSLLVALIILWMSTRGDNVSSQDTRTHRK